jgi:CubicO group peptidase (beta-lactamase class C family)
VRRVLTTAIAVALLSSCSSSDTTAHSTLPSATSSARAPTTPPTEPSTSAPTTSVEHRGDAAAANFTRKQFANLSDDEPGCTVAVGQDGAVVFAEAYGAARLDPFKPMTVDTVVDIGDVSTQFTATAILLLAERGEVDLDAPLSTYLPDLPAWASATTLAQLIHHVSGIPDYIGLLVERGFVDTGDSPTIADALAVLGDVVDLDFAPGKRWEYSNSNYFLLSQVVLAVTGDDLGTFLAAEVFEPLGLDMVMDPTAAIDDKAVSYKNAGGKWKVADSRWEVTIGTGGIQTTPSQLVAWAAQYWEPTIGAPTINAERFEGAVDAPVHANVDVKAGIRYGAGLFDADVGGDVGQVLGSTGYWGGFVSVFSVAPAHRVAVAVTCTSPSAWRRLPSTIDIDVLTSWIGSR